MTKRTPGKKGPAGPRPRASALWLMIETTLYGVKPLESDPDQAFRAFRLVKGDGTLYDVAETRWGTRCDCPDFIFRRDGLDPDGCKHVRALVAGGLLAPTRARPPARRAPAALAPTPAGLTMN